LKIGSADSVLGSEAVESADNMVASSVDSSADS
jgi:hypothetical protein